MALKVAEKALDGLPIPGLKGAIGALVMVIKKLDVCIMLLYSLERQNTEIVDSSIR